MIKLDDYWEDDIEAARWSAARYGGTIDTFLRMCNPIKPRITLFKRVIRRLWGCTNEFI